MAVYCIKCEAMNHADAVRCSLCGWDLQPEPVSEAVAVKTPVSEPRRSAPVVNTGYEAERNANYRLPDDPDYVIRINQDWPAGIGINICDDLRDDRDFPDSVPVAGVSHRADALNALIDGTDRRVELLRDRENRRDPTAIKVIGHWRDRHGVDHFEQLGWVPSELAHAISRRFPTAKLGARIARMSRATDDRSPAIRINIGRPVR